MSKRRKGLSFYQRKKKVSPKIVKEIFGWIFGMLVAMFAAGVAAYFLGMTTKVVGVFTQWKRKFTLLYQTGNSCSRRQGVDFKRDNIY